MVLYFFSISISPNIQIDIFAFAGWILYNAAYKSYVVDAAAAAAAATTLTFDDGVDQIICTPCVRKEFRCNLVLILLYIGCPYITCFCSSGIHFLVVSGDTIILHHDDWPMLPALSCTMGPPSCVL
jgi:hypothetical protein